MCLALSVLLVTLVTVASMPITAALLLRAVERPARSGHTIPMSEAKAIVILGGDVNTHAPEYGGETVGVLTLERLRYAAHLHREMDLPLLVTGGAYGHGGGRLANLMQVVLAKDFSVPVTWVEDSASNTFENASRSKKLLAPEGIDVICLVTHAWHMRRAQASFEALGLNVIPCGICPTRQPTPVFSDFLPVPSRIYQLAWALREVFGNVWYRSTYLRPHRKAADTLHRLQSTGRIQ